MTHKSKQAIIGNLFFSTVLVLSVFSMVVNEFYMNIDWLPDTSWWEKIVYLNRLFSDFFLYASLVFLFYGKNKISKSISVMIAAIFTFIYFIQFKSLQISGAYLPSIALENYEHVDFLDTDQLIYAGVIWMVIFICSFLIIKLIYKSPSIFSRVVWFFIMIFISIVIKNDNRYLPESTIIERFDFYDSGRPGIPHASPISEFINTVSEYSDYLLRQHSVNTLSISMTPLAAEFAYDYDYRIGELNTDYPLLKKPRYEEPIDFLSSIVSENPLNIIVIFAEGISARVIQPYSDYFPNISPNILDFSKQTIRVDNYYSHAYATYRGLGAQLCSTYPIGRLLDTTNYYCLGHALKEDGYSTQFLISQSLRKTDLDRIFKNSGFEDVYGSKELQQFVSKSAGRNLTRISDRQLFEGLISKLKNLEDIQSKPFLMGVYNFETHTGVKTHEIEKYQRTDKEQIDFLDAFYNLDFAFGEFWKYFKQSKHYKNTIVVFTTDHATFPSREYKKEFENDPSFTSVFADTIPLLIYYPNLTSYPKVDARDATSVNLVPSLLHLMGIEKDIVPFVGSSIFDVNLRFPIIGVSEGEPLLVIKPPSKWMKISKDTREDLIAKGESLEGVALYDFIQYLQNIEATNRIWKKGD